MKQGTRGNKGLPREHGISLDNVPLKLIEKRQPMRHKDYRRVSHRKDAKRAWDYKEFIAWDGEGLSTAPTLNLGDGIIGECYPQCYVTLANSKGDRISEQLGLSTRQCFEMILDAKQKYPDSIFVGFGFNYDINQMLADIPEECRERLYNKGTLAVGGYWMEWRPRKFFTLVHRKTKRSARIYDVFGFFQQSFLDACREYLGKDDPDLEVIRQGKEDRTSFDWHEMDDKIIPYNNLELSMLVRIMNQLRQDLHDVGINPSQWHGPGAIASEVLKKYDVRISRTIPEEVLDAAQYAYAGGRFECFRLGRHQGSVYEYDIHSAYPAGAFGLPDLSDGAWEYVERFEPGTFGVWRVEYKSTTQSGRDARPEPLFCRSEDGSISFPTEVQGWYWTPEAGLVPDSVQGGWVFRSSYEDKPFAFIAGLYDERRVLKDQKKSAQRALKLVLNSLYGKLAQTVGGKKGPPRWHQLEYAGYITSYTRAMIYRAIISNPGAIIAAETDAVFSTEPLDLPVSDELGDWERKDYVGITYLQSGFYYAERANGEIVCKYRGMDRDRVTQQPVKLPYRKILDHLARYSGQEHRFTKDLLTHTTRFIGLGMAIKTHAVWRSWVVEPKHISLDQKPWCNKRYHLSEECPECRSGFTLNDCLHTTFIGGYAGRSFARSLPWRHVKEEKEEEIWHEAPQSWEEWQEMDNEFLVLEEADRWS